MNDKPEVEKANAFDPSSMEFVYEAGGRKLTLRPLKWGSFKRLLKLFNEPVADQGNQIYGILKLLFSGPEFEFLTPEFFDEEITVRLSGEIIQKAVEINGLANRPVGI